MSDPVDIPPPRRKRARKTLSSKAPALGSPDESEALVDWDKQFDQASADPLPDYEHRHEERSHRFEFLKNPLADKRLLVLAGVLICLLVGWFAGLPVYREVKVWRALELMSEGQEEADNGNVPKAMDLMRKAVLMAPTNEEVFRVVRLFNAGLGDVSSLAALQQKMVNGEADPEELVVLAEQSLKAGQTVLVNSALSLLDDHKSARKTILEMKVLDSEGSGEGAFQLARKTVPTLSPKEANKLILATAEMLLFKEVEGSRKILGPLVARKDHVGIAAIRLLARQQLWLASSGNAEGIGEVAVALSKHPLATTNDKLLEADLRIAIDPAQKQRVVSALASAFNNPKLDGAIDFARWLNRRQAHPEAIEFIGRERALGDAEWLLVYLDAHAALERWSDVFSMLDAETVVGLSDSIRLMFLARAAEESGDAVGADQSWREMQRTLMYEKPEVASFVANYTTRIGQLDQAFKAFQTMSKHRETSLQGYLGMIRTWPSDAPLEDLVDLYKEFLGNFPNIGEARVDLAYLQLLTGQDLQNAADESLKIFLKEPNSLATLSVAALGRLKTGSPQSAAMLYEGKSIPWGDVPPQWRVIRVAVLVGNGQAEEASHLAASIKVEKLRPQEQELLKSVEAGFSAPLNP